MRASAILFVPSEGSTVLVTLTPAILAGLVPRQDAASGAQSAASSVQSGAESAASSVQSASQSGAAPSAMSSSPAGVNNSTGSSGNVTTGAYGIPDNATVAFPNVTIPARCNSVCDMYSRVTDACRTNATSDACLAVCGNEWAPFDTCLECLDDADVPNEDQLEDQQEILEALCLRSGHNPHASLGASGNVTINFPNITTVPQVCQDQCNSWSNVTRTCSANSTSDDCLAVCAPEEFTKFRQCVRCLDKAEDDDDDDDDDDKRRRRRKRDGNDLDDAEDKIELVCRANGKDPRAGTNTTTTATSVNMPADANIPQQCQVMCPSYSKYAGACGGNVTSADCMRACQPAEFRLLDLCIECLDDHNNNTKDINDEIDHLEDICRAQGHDPKFAANGTQDAAAGGSSSDGQGGAQGERSSAQAALGVPIAAVVGAAVLALL